MSALPARLVRSILWASWHRPHLAYPRIHPLPFGIEFPQFVVLLTCESLLATILFHEGIHLGDPSRLD
jgi:hypothetical protein